MLPESIVWDYSTVKIVCQNKPELFIAAIFSLYQFLLHYELINRLQIEETFNSIPLLPFFFFNKVYLQEGLLSKYDQPIRLKSEINLIWCTLLREQCTRTRHVNKFRQIYFSQIIQFHTFCEEVCRGIITSPWEIGCTNYCVIIYFKLN